MPLRPEWKNPAEIVSFKRGSGEYFYVNSTTGVKMNFDEQLQIWEEEESMVKRRFS